MSLNYYLSVFPTEALIASELGPDQFGAYMATGSKKGSAEQIIFFDLEGDFDSVFDWDYAKEKMRGRIPTETPNIQFIFQSIGLSRTFRWKNSAECTLQQETDGSCRLKKTSTARLSTDVISIYIRNYAP